MQTTPNLGLTIPSADTDPFDELAYSNALVTVDTWSAKAADKTAAATQAFTGNLQAPTINATVGYQVNGSALAASNVLNAADKSAAAAQAFTGSVTVGGANDNGAAGMSTGIDVSASGYVSIARAAGNGALATSAPGDTQFRYLLDTNGRQSWSTGAAAADTALARLGAGQLQLSNPNGATATLFIGDATHTGAVRPSGTAGLNVGGAATEKLGFYGAAPIVQPTQQSITAGYTAGTGATVVVGGLFTGNLGTTPYTISDIVYALKTLGLIKT